MVIGEDPAWLLELAAATELLDTARLLELATATELLEARLLELVARLLELVARLLELVAATELLEPATSELLESAASELLEPASPESLEPSTSELLEITTSELLNGRLSELSTETTLLDELLSVPEFTSCSPGSSFVEFEEQLVKTKSIEIKRKRKQTRPFLNF